MDASESPAPLVSRRRRGGRFPRLRGLASLAFGVFGLVVGIPCVATAPITAFAVTPEIPAGHESYLRRPDILKLRAQAHPELGQDWESLKRGHAEAVAQLLEMYPDRELYFLARDSELLYDLARIVTQGHPEQRKRLHLLNVSRANMRDPRVRDYLAQEGISEASLKAGKKVLFVDTGFSGTIPRVISELFPEALRPQLNTHLMASSNKDHPSSLGFLTSINPAAPGLAPGSLHGSIVSYEHMPRFTDRSTGFAQVQGRWEPISPEGKSSQSNQNNQSNDGQVSPQKAQAYQEDLLAYAQSAEAQALIARRRSQWKKLREVSQAPGVTNDALALELRALLDAHPKDPFNEALVRDFLDLQATNLAPSGGASPLSASALGLAEVTFGAASESNKNALIKKHPEWAPVLENPQTGIAKLIAAEEWGKLGAITDAIHDEEFVRLLAKALGAPASAGKSGLKPFVRMLIEKGDLWVLQYLAIHAFSQPHMAEMQDLLKLLIEAGDPGVLQRLAIYVFSQPHVAGMKDLLRLLIEKGDKWCLKGLAEYAFSQPHTAEMKDLLKLLIEKGSPETLRSLAVDVFSKPHTAGMTELMQLLIEKGDAQTLQSIADHDFSRPHWRGPEHERLRKAIQIQDPVARKAFLQDRASSGSDHPPAPAAAPAAVKGPALFLQEGGTMVTPSGRSLRVLELVDEGKRGRVYRVRDEASGQVLALKVARDAEAETLASLAQEAAKAKTYQKLGIAHAPVLETQPDFVLKEWVEGTRADAWMKSWVAQGSPPDAPQILALHQLLDHSAQQGAYIGDLNAKHLVWRDPEWVVVDSGSVREGLSVEEVWGRYIEKIPARWGKKAGDPSASSCLAQALALLVSAAAQP